MSLMEDLDLPLLLTSFRDTLLHHVSASISTATCAATGTGTDDCRDDVAALRLKMAAVLSILLAGVTGVAVPLLGRKRGLHTDGGLFFFAKAFAAGVILGTGFVHMLHDAQSALSDPCLPESPWRRFPVSGFVAMMAALWTLVSEFVGTLFYEWKHRQEKMGSKKAGPAAIPYTAVVTVETEDEQHGHGHGHGHGGEHEASASNARHAVTSQILELGIVSHSVIIGLSLGVSQSPCTIRPLVAALSFHQFFEGFALGGCISQAKFKNLSTILMACFFSITTPTGICVGASLASFYNTNSPRAHVVEGLLDSVSAGILIYMALVDLIAADFLGGRLRSDLRLQVASFVALFLGAGCMSALAIWV